jgi:hypothetical protein
MDFIKELITEVGPWAALCAVLLWWIQRQLSNQRADHAAAVAEQRKMNAATVARLQANEDWIRNTHSAQHGQMITVIADVTHALRENIQASRDTQRTNRDLLLALRTRPCMHDADLPEAPQQPPTEPAIERKGRTHA